MSHGMFPVDNPGPVDDDSRTRLRRQIIDTWDTTSILDILGEWDDAHTWQQHAACKGQDTRLFFGERGESALPAKQICAGCPVKTECLEHALEEPERVGVWGGLTERQRKPLRRVQRRDVKPPCGSNNGYKWHKNHGEPVCPACAKARSLYVRDRRVAPRGRKPAA